MEYFDEELVEKIKDGDGGAISILMSSLDPLIKAHISSCPQFDIELFKDIIRTSVLKSCKKYNDHGEMDLLEHIELSFPGICKESFSNYYFKRDYANMFSLFDEINERGLKKTDFIKFIFKMAGYKYDDTTANKILAKYRTYDPAAKQPAFKAKFVKNKADKKPKEFEEPKEEESAIDDVALMDLAENARNGSSKHYDKFIDAIKKPIIDNYINSIYPKFNFDVFKERIKDELLKCIYDYNDFSGQTFLEYLKNNFKRICKKSFRDYYFNGKYTNIFELLDNSKNANDRENTLKFVIIASGYKYDLQTASRIIAKYSQHLSKKREKEQVDKDTLKSVTKEFDKSLTQDKSSEIIKTNDKQNAKIEEPQEPIKETPIQSKPVVVGRGPSGIDLVQAFDRLYTRTELSDAVKGLKDKQRKVVYKYCGPRLDGYNAKRLNNEEQDYNAYVFEVLCDKLNEIYGKRMKGKENEIYKAYMAKTKYAESAKTTKKEKPVKEEKKKKKKEKVKKEQPERKTKKRSNLIQYYDGKYSLEQLKEIIDAEDYANKYSVVIYKYCGVNLDGENTEKLTPEERKIFTYGFSIINNLLKDKNSQKRNSKNLIRYYNNEFTAEQLKKIIDSTVKPKELADVIYEFSGQNLLGVGRSKLPEELRNNHRIAKGKLTTAITKLKKIRDYVKTINELTSEIPKEQIDAIIELLPIDQQEKVKKAINTNSDDITEYEMEIYEELLTLLEKVYNKIRIVHANKFTDLPQFGRRSNLIAFYDYKFSASRLKEIINSDKFIESQRKLIYDYCGKNLDGMAFCELSSNDYAKLTNIIYKISRELNYFPDSIKEANIETKPFNVIQFFGGVLNATDIEAVVSILPPEEQVRFKKLCGKNYDGVVEDESYISWADPLNKELKDKVIKRLRIVYQDKIGSKIIKLKWVNLVKFFEGRCSKEVIEEVLKSLLEKDQQIIYKCCGKNLDGLTFYEPTEEEMQVLANFVNMLKYRSKRNDPTRIISRKGATNLIKLTGDLLTKEELDRIIDLFKPEEILDIKRCIGPEYNGKNVDNASIQDLHLAKQNIDIIVRKARIVYVDKYQKAKNYKPIGYCANLMYYLAYKHTKEEIDEVLNSANVNESTKNIIIAIAGSNYDGLNLLIPTKEQMDEYKEAIKLVSKLLRGNKKSQSGQKNNLIEILENKVSKEEIQIVVDLFNEDDKKDIYNMFGENFDGKVQNKIPIKNKKVSSILINRIHIVYYDRYKIVRLKNIWSNLIASLDYALTKEEIEEIIKDYQTDLKELIHKYCGENLDGLSLYELNDKEYREMVNFMPRLKTAKRRKESNTSRRKGKNLIELTGNKLTKEQLDRIVNLFSEEEISDIKNYTGPNYDGEDNDADAVKDLDQTNKNIKIICLKAKVVYRNIYYPPNSKEKPYGYKANLIGLLDYKYTKKEIDEALKDERITAEYRELIINYCGPEYDGLSLYKIKEENHYKYDCAINWIKKILNPEMAQKRKPTSKAKTKKAKEFERLKNVLTDSEFITIVETLDLDDQDIIVNYMENIIDCNKISKETNTAIKNFVNKAKLAYPLKFDVDLDTIKNTNLIAFLKYKYSLEQLKYIIDSNDFPEKYRVVIYKHCGDNLNGLSKETLLRKEKAIYIKAINLLFQKLHTIDERLLVNATTSKTRLKVVKVEELDLEEKPKENLEEIITNIKTSSFYKELIANSFTSEESLIIAGYTGYSKTVRLSIEQIALLLNVDISTAKNLINETLCKFKSYINNNLDKHILELHN